MARNPRGSIAVNTAKLGDMVESGELGWKFANGTILSLGLAEIYADYSKMESDAAKFAFARGLFEKVRDSYAGATTVDEALEIAEATIELLKSGEWYAERGPVGPRLSDLREVVDAIRVEQGKSPYSDDDFKAEYTGKAGADKRERVRKHPKVAAMLAAIAERKAAERREKADKAAAASTESIDV